MMDDERPRSRQNRRAWRPIAAYVTLILSQLVFAPSLPGYVHPDEFFQGGQELWFGCPPKTSWEFEPRHAVRSVVPPAIMTWLPLRTYALMKKGRADMKTSLSGLEVLIVPRVFCIFLSVLVVYGCIWRLSCVGSAQRGAVVPTSVLIAASAWPSWVLLSRPFSNSLETVLLALLLVVSMRRTKHMWRDALIGILCALGLFTRFTFVGYAIPSVLSYLTDKFLLNRMESMLQCMGVAFFGFLVTASTFIYVDSLFYGSSSFQEWTSFIAPLNGILYNSKIENLQTHGLHPRWTHAVVNMSLLFGPLAIAFYLYLGHVLLDWTVRPGRAAGTTDWATPNPSTLRFVHPSTIRSTCVWTIVLGLCFLSLAPHQEPRFLLPVLVPLCVLSGDLVVKSRAFIIGWVVFNVILLVVFGILHQGGVVPVLVSGLRSDTIDPGTTVFFFRTYMPPTFASRRGETSCTAAAEAPYCDVDACPPQRFVDLRGGSTESLTEAITAHLDCSSGAVPRSAHIVTSTLISSKGRPTLDAICLIGESYSCRQLGAHFPHLSTEDLPSYDGSFLKMIRNMQLGVYEISCAN